MSTPITPATPVAPTIPNWVSLLVTLGANIGATFVKNTNIGQLINLAAAETTAIINQIQTAKAAAGAGGVSVASSLVVPLFVDALLGGLSVAVTEGKISAADAAELSKAVAAMAQEDLAAKTSVDYSTIGTIVALK